MKKLSRTILTSALTLLLVVSAAPTNAFAEDDEPEPGITLVSSPDGTTEADGSSWEANINSAGAVVFGSSASNLPGANGEEQIYLWTSETGVTLVTNVGTPEMPLGANGLSDDPRINDAGTVVFWSRATDLPGVDLARADGHGGIFLWTPSGGFKLIAEGYGREFRINARGSVVFLSNDSQLPGGVGCDLHAGMPDCSQVYLWTVADGLTLLTNIGTPESPVGPIGHNVTIYDGPEINASDSVVFDSCAAGLPGASSDYTGLPSANCQVYLWTAVDGLNVIGRTDMSILPDDSRVSSYHYPKISDSGTVVFRSNSPDLPGARDYDVQAYLWTPEDGVTLISNVGTPENPVGAHGDVGITNINTQGAVVFTSNSVDLPGGNARGQVYLWTASQGLTLLTNVGTPEVPTGAKGDPDSLFWNRPCMNNAGAVVFSADAYDLPGGNGHRQAYLWTPADGLSLITNLGTDANLLGTYGFGRAEQIGENGSVLLSYAYYYTTSPDQEYGPEQVYLWTPAETTATSPSATPAPSVDTKPPSDNTADSLDTTTIVLVGIIGVGVAVALGVGVTLLSRSRKEKTG
jgi:hypothetical protein